MPKVSHERIIPTTRLLVTGRQESMKGLFARRPGGVEEWILIYNEGGRSYFKSADGEWSGKAGDVVLIRPGTPHEYGMDREHSYWKNTWAHFLPQPDCLDWLQWPEFAPGMMRLHLDEPVGEQVLAELYKMDAAAHASGHRHEEFAVNALERALLLCDSQNSRHDHGWLDARIRKAVDLLMRHAGERLSVEEMARHCGLSRSRFAELFSEQVGMPPLAFLENQRLRCASELLEHTSLSIAEIAEQSGFSSPFYFSLRFKKNCGESPSDFRRIVRQHVGVPVRETV